MNNNTFIKQLLARWEPSSQTAQVVQRLLATTAQLWLAPRT